MPGLPGPRLPGVGAAVTVPQRLFPAYGAFRTMAGMVFSPIRLGLPLDLANRIATAPMCRCSAGPYGAVRRGQPRRGGDRNARGG